MPTQLQPRPRPPSRRRGDPGGAGARIGRRAAPTATRRAAQPCRRSPASPCTPRAASCSRWSARAAAARRTLLELICGLQSPDAGSIELRAGGADAPARPAAAVAERARQRGARAAHRARAARARRARAASALFAELGLDGFEQRPPARALGRDAPARGVPAHAALGQAGAVPGRAVRRARRDHARGDAGLAGGRLWRASRARWCSSPTTSRRRSCWPTASPCSRRVPAACSPSSRSALARPRSRTDPQVIALRERALRRSSAGWSCRARIGRDGQRHARTEAAPAAGRPP